MKQEQDYFKMFNEFLNNQAGITTSKKVKSFEQKGWELSLKETSTSKYFVELRRDDFKVDRSSEVVDYKTANVVFNEWMATLNVEILNKGNSI